VAVNKIDCYPRFGDFCEGACVRPSRVGSNGGGCGGREEEGLDWWATIPRYNS